MRAQLILLATASLVAATPAFAQDAARFTGVRIEVNSGYDSIRYDDGIAATPNTLDGIRIGAAVGYDMPIGKVLTVGAMTWADQT